MRVVLMVGGVLGGVLATGAAHAAPPCSEAAIEDQVRVLGGSLDGVRDRVQIELARDRIEGSVTYVTAGGDVIGPRVVQAATCKELATSLALVIVMSMHADEPVAHEAAPIVDDATDDNADNVTGERGAARVAPVEVHTWPQPRAHTNHVAAFLGAASDAGGLPALVLGSRWRRDRFSLGLELHVAAPQSFDVGDGGSVRVSQTGLDAVPCVHAGALALCGLASAGVIGGEGRQLAEAMAVYRPALAVGGRLELDVPIVAHVSLRLHVDGLQALTSSRFLVDQMAVWTSDSRELWLGAGVLATFP